MAMSTINTRRTEQNKLFSVQSREIQYATSRYVYCTVFAPSAVVLSHLESPQASGERLKIRRIVDRRYRPSSAAPPSTQQAICDMMNIFLGD